MSTGLINGAPYPSPAYGTGGNQNQKIPQEGKPQPYGPNGATLSWPYKAPIAKPEVSTQVYPPIPYGINAATHGPLMALRTPLLEGPPFPTTPYGASHDTGTPGHLRRTLIEGAPYPTTPYGPGNQTSNSQYAGLVHTFRVNLQTLFYWAWALPNRTTLDGNEVTTEEQNLTLAHVRSTWIPSLFPGVEHIAHHDGDFLIAYGHKAQYLKNTYVNPNDPNAVLILVS